jgi:hypothetical protein
MLARSSLYLPRDFSTSAIRSSSCGKLPLSSFDQIFLPSTKTSKRPSANGESSSFAIFCLNFLSSLSVRPTALGS